MTAATRLLRTTRAPRAHHAARAALIAAVMWMPAAASAQIVHGNVSDSASRLAIAGAVVVLLDSAGTTLTRGISNAQGEYVLAAAATGRRLRVMRLGFRPRDVSLADLVAGERVDVRMIAIPTLLESIMVVANASCPRRPEREQAFALLEQARAGLLNAIVAREQYPATMTLLAFERRMHGTSDSILRQTVRVTSGDRLNTSFYAARRARDFVRDGFVHDVDDDRVYFGPDIDVLLDEDFTAGYCFHLRAPQRGREVQVGLGFAPAVRRRGRVDIDGTLWIDTAARKLEELDYRYLGLPSATDAVRPGGRATFWELPNGIVFIDKWNMRLPQAEADTLYSATNRPIVRAMYSAREPGGELASARWPDGQSYQGPLGTLHARTADSTGKPVTGIVVRLHGTDYVASPDSNGRFAINDLLPGPYTAMAIHPELASFGITLPTSLRFIAVRDSVLEATVRIPGLPEVVRQPCDRNPMRYEDDSLLVLRVATATGAAIDGAQWQLRKVGGDLWPGAIETRFTDADGRARHCMLLRLGDEVEIQAWHHGVPSQTYRRSIGRKGIRVTITLPSSPSP